MDINLALGDQNSSRRHDLRHDLGLSFSDVVGQIFLAFGDRPLVQVMDSLCSTVQAVLHRWSSSLAYRMPDFYEAHLVSCSNFESNGRDEASPRLSGGPPLLGELQDHLVTRQR